MLVYYIENILKYLEAIVYIQLWIFVPDTVDLVKQGGSNVFALFKSSGSIILTGPKCILSKSNFCIILLAYKIPKSFWVVIQVTREDPKLMKSTIVMEHIWHKSVRLRDISKPRYIF